MRKKVYIEPRMYKCITNELYTPWKNKKHTMITIGTQIAKYKINKL